MGAGGAPANTAPPPYPPPAGEGFRGRSAGLAGAGRGLLYVALLLGAASLFGLVSALYGNLFTERPRFLLALPIVLALLVCFAVSRPALLLVLLFLRAPLDPLMEVTRMQLGPIPLGLGAVVNALILLLVASLVFDRDRPPYREGLRLWGPFVAMCIVGVALTSDRGGAVRTLLAFLTFPAAFLAGSRQPPQRERFDAAVGFVLASMALVCTYAVVGLLSGEALYTVYFRSEEAGLRLAGPFPHPNILAFYLVTAIALGVYVLHERRQVRWRGAVLLAAYVLLCAVPLLLLTKTRSAWAAAYLMLLAYALLANRKALPLLLLGPLLALLVPDVRERLAELQSNAMVTQYAKLDSYAWRQLMWTSALGWMTPAHYPAGYGLDMFVQHSPAFFPLSGKGAFGAHNVYVQVFFELGLLGLGAWLWLMGSLLVGFWRLGAGDRPASAPRRGLARAAAAAARARAAAASAATAPAGAAAALPAQPALKAPRALLVYLTVMYLVVSYSDNMLDYLVFNLVLFYLLGAGWALRGAARPVPARVRRARHAPAWDVSFLPPLEAERP